MADVMVRFVGDSDSAVRATEHLRESLTGLKGEADTTSAKLAHVATAIAERTVEAATVGIVGLAGAVSLSGFRFDEMKEKATIAFTQLLGSTDAAQKKLDELASFAAQTPFGYDQIVKLSQGLLTAGYSADALIPTLKAASDAVTVVGGGAEGLDKVVAVFRQMEDQGKVTTRQFLTLGRMGIPAIGMVADQLGVSTAKVYELINKGQLDTQSVISAITLGMENQYGDLAKKNSETMGGVFKTIKDTFAQVSGTIMQPTFDLITVGLGKIGAGAISSQSRFHDLAVEVGQELANGIKAVVEFFIRNWPTINDLIQTAWTLAGDLVQILIVQVGVLNSVAGAVGGWKDALEFLLAGVVVARVVALAQAIRTDLIANGFTELKIATEAEQAAYLEAFGAMEIATVGLSATIKAALISTGFGALAVAVGIVVVEIINHWETVKQWFVDFGHFLPGLFSGMWSVIKGVTDLAIYGLLAEFDLLLKAIAGAVGHIPFIGSRIKKALDEAAGYIDQFRTNGLTQLKNGLNEIGDAADNAFTKVTSLAAAIANTHAPAAGTYSTPYSGKGGIYSGSGAYDVNKGVDLKDENPMIPQALKALAKAGYGVDVTSGYRTEAQQAALYARYVSSGFNIKYIAAKPGQSNHETGSAVDIYVNGKPVDQTPGALAILKKYGLVSDVPGDHEHLDYVGDKPAAYVPPPPTIGAPTPGKAKAAKIVSGQNLIDGGLRGQISDLADKAANALKAGSKPAAIKYLESERDDLEQAEKEVQKTVDDSTGKQKAAAKAELTTIKNKIRDVGNAIEKAQVVAGAALLPDKLKAEVSAAADAAAQGIKVAQNLASDATAKNITQAWQTVVSAYTKEGSALEDEKASLQSRLATANSYQRAAIEAEIKKINTQIASVGKAVTSALDSERSALEQKVSSLQSAAGSVWNTVQGDILAQFQLTTDSQIKALGDKYLQNGQLTPSEQLLASMQAEDTATGLQSSLDQAKAAELADEQAQATQAQIDQDKAAVVQAQRALDEGNLALKAAKERADADASYAVELKKLQDERTLQETELTNVLAKFGDQVSQTGELSLPGLQNALDGANVYGTTFGITLDTLSTAVNSVVTNDFAQLSSSASSLAQALAELQAVVDQITGTTQPQASSDLTNADADREKAATMAALHPSASKSFVWGEDAAGNPITWTSSDLPAFKKYLTEHGSSYAAWVANHGTAAHAVFGFARGGRVPGPVVGLEDTVLARLSGGEEVIDRSLSRQLRVALAAGGFGHTTIVQATVYGADERQVGAALEKLVTPAAGRVASYKAP